MAEILDKSNRRRRRRRIALVVILLAVAFVVYITQLEPRWIQVTRHEVRLPGLPEELDGTVLVHLSDLHRSRLVPDSVIRRAIRIADSESPDIVAVTGDFINTSTANISPCADMLTSLKPRMGTFAVLGNHDYWVGAAQVRRTLESGGIEVLDNENREVAPGLFVIGLDDFWMGKPDVRRAWRNVDRDKAQVLLSHSPLAMHVTANRRCLILSGHTHGGQANVPFVRRNRLPGLKGFPFISGWYRGGTARMYVNRGIGVVNPAIRFLCRPEVAVFTLHSAPAQTEIGTPPTKQAEPTSNRSTSRVRHWYRRLRGFLSNP